MSDNVCQLVNTCCSHEHTVLVAAMPVCHVILAADGGGCVGGGGLGVADAGGLVVWSGARLISKSPGGKDVW